MRTIMSVKRLRLATLLAFAAAATSVSAANWTAEQLKGLPPGLRAEALASMKVKPQAQSRVAATPGLMMATAAAPSIDANPPVLTSFDAGRSVNVASSSSQLVVNLSLTDDNSGLRTVWVVVRGPSGRTAWSAGPSDLPGLKSWAGRVGFTFTPWAEAGQWHVESVNGFDKNGNYFAVDQAALSKLGNTVFSVTSEHPDNLPPTLTGVKVLTPTISLSSPAPGTAASPPFVGVELAVTDPGPSDARSGVWVGIAQFCLRDMSGCFYMGGENITAYKVQNGKINLGTTLSSGQAVGEYQLVYAWVQDHAYNTMSYVGTAFGGTTDFNQMFGATSIVLTP